MFDMHGKQIQLGDQVKIYQFAQSSFFILPFDDMDFVKQLNLNYEVEYPDKDIELVPYGDEFMLMEGGKPSVMDTEASFTVKSPFMMSSEHDIPEMNVKKGDEVLCFGGEGYAAGVFRYHDYTLEVINR